MYDIFILVMAGVVSIMGLGMIFIISTDKEINLDT